MRTELVTALKRRATELLVREGIARGERAVEQGRVVTQATARVRLARWLK